MMIQSGDDDETYGNLDINKVKEIINGIREVERKLEGKHNE